MKHFVIPALLLLSLLANAQSPNLLPETGKVGIGTTAPRALLDVGLPSVNTSTSVLGRMPEGNGTMSDPGTGTYLGVQTYNTTPANSNSFAIEHKFYSVLNSSISFYRGPATYGGFLTFSTNNGTEKMRIDPAGNIGINTTTPTDKLTIDMGSTRNGINLISDGDAAAYSDLKFSLKTTTNTTTTKPVMWVASCRKDGYFSNDLTGATLEFYALRKDNGFIAPLLLKSNGDVILAGAKAAANGNVGIGTLDTKGYKLAVAGSMIAERVKVKMQSAWPDYVFEKDYKLPSLQELEAYIQQHKHLPDVPVATEVAEKGLDLGEMNRVLLQKVEELTLHLIEQEKKIKALEARMK